MEGKKENKTRKKKKHTGKKKKKRKGKHIWWRKGNSIKSFKTLHTGAAKKRASRQGKAAEDCHSAAPKALRTRHDDRVFRGGAGGSRGRIHMSVPRRCLAGTITQTRLQVAFVASRGAAGWTAARLSPRALHRFFRNS